MRVAGIAAVMVMVSFTACSTGDAGKPEPWNDELPIVPAFLRQQLPPEVLAYGRVPNWLGLLAMPKQSQLDTALRSEANVSNIQRIQEGLAQNVFTLPAFSDPRLRFLADVVRSPIEVAGLATPAPALLVGATLVLRSQTEFNALFTALGRVQPGVSLVAPLDDQGIGELAGLPLMAFIKFDAANGRMLLLAGPDLDRAAFEKMLGSLPAEPGEHPMHELEQKIDASGQGLFAWADAAQIMAAFAPNVAPQLGQAGLEGLGAVAFGVGTANGKGRLSLVADVGDERESRPFPVIANDVRATAVGDPDAAVLVSIPGPEEFTRLESMLIGTLPREARSGWEQVKTMIEGQIGVAVEEILSAVGPDLLFLFDEAGDYTAVHLRDADRFDDIVKRIAARTGSGPEEHKVGGTTVHYWRLPSIFSLAASPGVADDSGLGGDALAVLGRVQNHVYWIRDGEYLYVAQVPQPLVDRANAGAKARVAEWLAGTQRVDTSASLFAATGSVSKMPRRSYEMYIGILQLLADIAQVQFDAWSMPTADQLGLPDQGAIGFSLNLGAPHVSVELSFENHPGELFFGGGGVGGVAAAGILAAIAIPAYQDYTIRAQVTEGLNLASSVKVAVAESYATRGTLPRDRRTAGLAPSADSASGTYVESIDVSRGVITITYGSRANARLSGRTLVMAPFTTSQGDLGWLCGHATTPPGARPLVAGNAGAVTTIEPKYLPSACR